MSKRIIDRRVIQDLGGIVMVLETWNAIDPAELPICMLPRGARPPGAAWQRAVPMYRLEAIKMGLLKA